MEAAQNIKSYRGRMAWRTISVIALGSVTSSGVSAASTTEECANMVPPEDRRRGKGAFFSGCTTRSLTSGRGGCWSSLIQDQSGCQTCIVQGGTAADEWSSSVFSKFFEVELDPCPSSVAEVYGTPEGGIVSFEDVQSADCGNGDGDDMWFSLEDSCYSKSSYLDAAESWEDADVRCGEMGARLVSLESEEENDFVVQNLLWIGFLGEAYTGLRKMSGDGDWGWMNSLAGFPPGGFDPASSYQDWGAGLDASSFYESTGASCLEITPYWPKTWNPFSCEVNKQYVCEKPTESGTTDGATLAPRTPTPSTSPPVETPTPTLVNNASTTSPAPVATTSGPLTPYPIVMPSTSEPSGPSTAPPPPTSPDATLSPSTAEACTDVCLGTDTSSEHTAFYYDYSCEGRDHDQLAGCNVAASVSPLLENCRGCFINRDSYEDEVGDDGALDWPPCPCCVALRMGMDPQTEECIAEVASDDVVATLTPTQSPAPTATTPPLSPTLEASSSPRSIANPSATAVPSAVPTPTTSPVSPAPSSLAPTLSGGAEQRPQSTDTTTTVETGSPTTSAASGSNMSPFSGSSSTEFPTEFPTGSPTGSPTGAPTGAPTGSPASSLADSSGAEKLRTTGLEVQLLLALLLVLGVAVA